MSQSTGTEESQGSLRYSFTVRPAHFSVLYSYKVSRNLTPNRSHGEAPHLERGGMSITDVHDFFEQDDSFEPNCNRSRMDKWSIPNPSLVEGIMYRISFPH